LPPALEAEGPEGLEAGKARTSRALPVSREALWLSDGSGLVEIDAWEAAKFSTLEKELSARL